MKNKGITLVALVITVIILLILATISIQSLTNTGIFASANKAKLEVKRSQIKEWLSLNLFEVQANHYNKTKEEILELARQNTEKSEELKKLGKKITVDDEISTEEYGKKVAPYYYVIVDDDLYRVSMSAQEFIGKVGKIDKKAPSVEISLSSREIKTEGTVTATVVQTDNQSGINIEKCKWTYNTISENIGTNPNNYTEKFTNTTENLTLTTPTSGIYYLHILSIDNAGNTKEEISKGIEVFITATEITKYPEKYYGKAIKNYNCINNVTIEKWKIFNSTENNIYLIANDYIERKYIPASTKSGTSTSNKLNMEDTNYKRTASFNEKLLNDYSGTANIENPKLKLLNSSYFEQNFTSEANNMKAVAYMLDTEAWKGFKDTNNKAEYAIGGPTIEMLFSSYNKKNKTSHEAKAISETGYLIKKDNLDDWKYYIQNLLIDNENFYRLDNAENANGMWLASPSCYYISGLLYSYIDGSIYMDGNIEQKQLRLSSSYLSKFRSKTC